MLARGAARASRARGPHPRLHPPSAARPLRAQPDPIAAIGAYLETVAAAAEARGYRFDRARIDRSRTEGTEPVRRIRVTDGQLALELAHLHAKLAGRSPDLPLPRDPVPHPLFIVEPGPVEPWERVDPPSRSAPQDGARS